MTDTQAITVRLPRDLYEALRHEAFVIRQPMNQIITDALRLRLKGLSAEQYGDLCALFEAAWHHAVPESLDELAPMTSQEARKLALLATEVMTRPVPAPAEAPLNATEQLVWRLWGQLPDGDPSPVKHIARELSMTPADVAFIVYPAEKFGRWEDSQEPDLPG